MSATRVVARGDALLSPSVSRTLISSIAGRGPAQPVDASVLSVLTGRETEVLAGSLQARATSRSMRPCS